MNLFTIGLFFIINVSITLASAGGESGDSTQRDSIDQADHFCVFISLNQPCKANGVALQKMLKAKGFESYFEGEEVVSLLLTEKEIWKLFHAHVSYQTVVASSHRGSIFEPCLEGVIVPQRFRKLVSRVYFDTQLE
jgi:hypothetical protein